MRLTSQIHLENNQKIFRIDFKNVDFLNLITTAIFWFSTTLRKDGFPSEHFRCK